MSELVIANGVTLETINPLNCALHNDYMDNLLCSAFLVFPRLVQELGDRRIKVLRGYLPYSYIMREMTEAPDGELLKHTKGKAFVVSWDGWKEHEAFIIARTLYDEIDIPSHFIIDSVDETLYIGLGFAKSAILHITNNERRLIAKRRIEAA